MSAACMAWLQQQATAMPAAELHSLCAKMNSEDLRTRLRSTLAAAPESPMLSVEQTQEAAAAVVEAASDEDLFGLLHAVDLQSLQNLVTWSPAAANDVLPTGRRVGRYAAAEVIAAGPLVTFRPGGRNSSSSGGVLGGRAAWLTEQMVHTVTPWLTVAARSMWLMGQLLSELLPGGSSSSHVAAQREQRLRYASSEAPINVDQMNEEDFVELLEMAYACVEWLGSQLCHMQLPGDDAATLSISFSPEDAAARMPLLTQLLQQHAQLQAGMFAAVQRTAAAGLSGAQQHDIKSAAAAAMLQRM
jgi:hypothetical protein